METVVKKLESLGATEIYITAVPVSEGGPEVQAERLFTSIAESLTASGARLFQERIFATEDAFDRVLPVRAAAYGLLDDGVQPTLLACPEGPAGTIEGVQIHAVVCDPAPRPLSNGGRHCGRTLDFAGRRFISLSGSTATSPNGEAGDAEGMFARALGALKDAGSDFKSVIRTWLWLGDILNWYDDFNVCRNEFFAREKLIEINKIKGNGHPRLPASTGIGVHVAGPARCAIDLLAVVGGEDALEFQLSGGRQEAAFNYGSAFSRAAWSSTPAGRTFYVSGTASIDMAGRTTNIDDAPGQIEETIANVRALLDDAGCRDEHVVQSMIYCKTRAIRELFESMYARTLPWPQITTVAAVCRDDLLFEIEATACVPEAG